MHRLMSVRWEGVDLAIARNKAEEVNIRVKEDQVALISD